MNFINIIIELENGKFSHKALNISQIEQVDITPHPSVKDSYFCTIKLVNSVCPNAPYFLTLDKKSKNKLMNLLDYDKRETIIDAIVELSATAKKEIESLQENMTNLDKIQ